MILYILIVRSKDGLALSASTDFNDEGLRDVKESKKHLKFLSKKTFQYPDTCVMHTGTHSVYLQTELGVSYLALCDSSYPSVLAFSFLNELIKEFLGKCQAFTVNQARRPYSFIDFNNVIHSARQRYNKPQTLSTRINLAEMSEKIRINPPHVISLAEVQPLNGFHSINISNGTVVARLRLQPVSLMGYGISFVAFLLAIIDIFRAEAASSASYTIFDLDGPELTFHSIVFAFEAVLRIFQAFIYVQGGRRWLKGMWANAVSLLILGFFVYDLRDIWQNGLRLFVTAALVYMTYQRKYEMRLPDYNV